MLTTIAMIISIICAIGSIAAAIWTFQVLESGRSNCGAPSSQPDSMTPEPGEGTAHQKPTYT